jgi:hypothetical protein
VIYNQNIKGYNNSEWRYNVTISLWCFSYRELDIYNKNYKSK